MVRVSSPAKLRPWSELTAKMVMGVVPGLVNLAFPKPHPEQIRKHSKTLVEGKSRRVQAKNSSFHAGMLVSVGIGSNW